jgi:NosR/NirI family nitrous oxide reductase transcriptional regulator
VLMAALGGIGFGVSEKLSRVNATVRLADRIYLEEAEVEVDTTDASAAFRSTGESIESLYERAKAIQSQFAIGSVLCGVFIGMVIGVKLILESIRFKRDQYQANKGSCLACGRCYEYCPVGKKAKG